MKRLLLLCVVCLASSSAFAQRQVLLVTPQGIWSSTVKDGVPGTWVSVDADCIVQGFGGGGGTVPVPPKPEPDPEPTDAVTLQIAALSKSLGGGDAAKGKLEAMAIASTVEALQKAELTGAELTEALNVSSPLIDASLKANGRIVSWFKTATALTADASKLSAGVRSAWGISLGTVGSLVAAEANPDGTELTGEAVDFAQIIAILTMVLEILRKLGLIKS